MDREVPSVLRTGARSGRVPTAAIVVLLLLTFAGRMAVATAHHTSLIGKEIYKDDAFHYFQIASNVTEGRGFTADGVSRTNGFQPLFLFLLLPMMLAAGGDPIAPLHWAGVLAALISVGTAACLFLLARRLAGVGSAAFVVALWAISPYFIVHDVNGQETGLAMFFSAAALWFYVARVQSRPQPPLSHGVILGLVCGLGILARLDFVLLLAAMTADFAWRWWIRGRQPRRAAVMALALACAFAAWLPWAAVSVRLTGHALPLSGQASRLIALNMGWSNLSRIWSEPQPGDRREQVFFDPDRPPAAFHADVATRLAFVSLLEFPPLAPLRANSVFNPHPRLREFPLYVGFTRAPRVTLALAMLLAVAASWPTLRRRFRGRAEFAGRESIGSVLAFFLPLVGAAYVYHCPAHWNFNRYLTGAILVGTLCVGVRAGAYLRRAGPRVRFAGYGLAALVLVCQANNLRFFSDLSWTEVPPRGFLAAWDVLGSRVPESARAGAFQSGVMGYFSDRDLVNLDGKVNQDAFVALKQKRVHEYVAAQELDFVMDREAILYALYFRHAGPRNLRLSRAPVPPQQSAGVSLYRVIR